MSENFKAKLNKRKKQNFVGSGVAIVLLMAISAIVLIILTLQKTSAPFQNPGPMVKTDSAEYKNNEAVPIKNHPLNKKIKTSNHSSVKKELSPNSKRPKKVTQTQQQTILTKPSDEPSKSTGTAFMPEDLSMPSRIKVSKEAKNIIEPGPSVSDLESPNSSESYKDGMKAYKSKNYRNAVKVFSQLPKPAHKKRGPKDREEYVKGNFYKGLSLQKLGNLKQAVTAYQNVLDYERFFPICEMNLGICYLELRQFAKADRAFRHVVRDQNRIPPSQYDDIMQRTRYFWAIVWTKLFKSAKQQDKKIYFQKQAKLKWADYVAWFGKNKKYSAANQHAENYIKSLKTR
ncbi:MAG: tetratricopeptide repeat protein [Fibrobacteria bacterium]|nr:tetratricopeptide repeat protein [Fibrobacteria bacterium]